MAIQVIVNQAGPLPITATFSSPGDDPMYLEVNGSVWGQDSNNMLGIGIDVDGQTVGAAQIFSNGNTTHRTVVPAYIPIQLGEGNHTISLYLNNGETVSDFNDLYTAVIHY